MIDVVSSITHNSQQRYAQRFNTIKYGAQISEHSCNAGVNLLKTATLVQFLVIAGALFVPILRHKIPMLRYISVLYTTSFRRHVQDGVQVLALCSSVRTRHCPHHSECGT